MRALTVSAFLLLSTAALVACRADYPAGSVTDPHYADPAPDPRYAPPAVQDPAYAPPPVSPEVAPPPMASGPPVVITQPLR